MAVHSDLEIQWAACPAASALIQERLFSFDSYSAMTFGPVVARYAPVQLAEAQPSDEWIANSLDNFVRGEFSTSETEPPPFPSVPQRARERSLGDEHHRYLEACERDLIYSSHFESLLEAGGKTVSERIQVLLCDKRLGNDANNRHLGAQALETELAAVIDDHLRIRFVMPSFPFKDQNPFRTAARAHEPDLGDIGLIIRLHCLALALWHVHSDGADWILVSDGVVYSSIFGVEEEEAREYARRLRAWRDELNMQRTVALVDLADLVERADTAINGAQQPVTATRKHIRSALERGSKDGEESVRSNIAVLKRGMARNLSTRGLVGTIPLEELWWITRGGAATDLSEAGQRAHREIGERAHEAALEYAAFNLTMRHHEILAKYLPRTVRATIHPKAGQVAAPSLGRVFPWNGVAIERGGRFDDRSLSVTPLHDLTARYPRLVEKQYGDGSPLYYTPMS